MSLHRRTRVTPTFNMSSRIDIIFLLLIFFMITSTMVSPSAIKVNLPHSKKQTTSKAAARVVIDAQLNLYASPDGTREQAVTLDQLPAVLEQARTDSADLFVALYADENVPYRNIVEVLNVANDHHFRMVLATRPPKK